ncbi:hypothetical protein QAD02_007908 [Eretmocerus hayati]|uniref:Uncharacterized protein n=1 Tax=Eretmocerus hayati TaxID=131215 RepID=A0ACC2N586_9HYME|nr:hypothetical protein QAD02_007908 [Eretmocerus hayati]
METVKFLQDRIEYCKPRAMCKRATREAYKNHIAQIESSISDDSKKFWQYTRSLNNDSKIPSKMGYKGDSSENPRDIVDMFSDHFGSVFKDSSLPEKFKALENIQHGILCFALKKSGNPMSFMDHDFTPHLERFTLLTIIQLHKYHDYLEVYKLLNGYVKSNELLSKFEFRYIPHDMRCIGPILGEQSKSVFIGHAPLNRLRTMWNQLGEHEKEAENINKFKKLARSKVKSTWC